MDKLLDIMENNTLDLQDTFAFKCRSCGKCCKNREDILLSPYDLFRMARHLKMTSKDLVAEYCEWYVGQNSHFPIVRIKPRGANLVCPFLNGKLCRVHESKPNSCALFPLGRAIKFSPETKEKEVLYFLQPVPCSIKKKQTVDSWLTRFKLKDSEKYFLQWSDFLAEASPMLTNFDEKFSKDIIDNIFVFIYVSAYLSYDISMDFEPQFTQNLAKIRQKLKLAEHILRMSPENN